MDFDFDSDCDGGLVSDSDYTCYTGDGDVYYEDDSDVGDYDDVTISGPDNFHGYLDEIHAGEDLEPELDGNDRVLAPDLGGDGRDLAAEFDGDDRDLEREIGIDGRDDSDGDVDIAAELGLGDGDYFDDIRELAAGFEIHGGDYDVDGGDLSAVEVSSIIGDGFNGDRDFEVEFGVLGNDGDRHLLEAELGLNVEDLYGVDNEEAMTAFLIDIGAHQLVPVVEVDDGDDDDNDDSDEGGDELVPVVEVDDDDDDDSDDYHNDISGDEVVPVVEVDDVISDYYYSGGEHLRVEDLDGEPLYMDDDEDFLLFRDNYTSTREITVQASPLMNSSSHGRVEHLIELNSSPNVRRNEEENDGNLAKKLKDGEMASSSEEDTNANGSENDGVSCPICLEPWTTDGDHIICCLPCGHVYGMSCIKSWLQQPNSEKCPLCNNVCSVEGIRKIYGLTIVTVEKDLKEKIQLLEARCASLELNNGDWQRKEAEWRQSEAVLLQQLKPNTNN